MTSMYLAMITLIDRDSGKENTHAGITPMVARGGYITGGGVDDCKARPRHSRQRAQPFAADLVNFKGGVGQ